MYQGFHNNTCMAIEEWCMDFIISVLQCIKGHFIPGRVKGILQMFNTYQQSSFELRGEVAVKHCRRPVDVAQVMQVCNWGSMAVSLLNHLIQFERHLGIIVSLAVILSWSLWSCLISDWTSLLMSMSQWISCSLQNLPPFWKPAFALDQLHFDSQALCFLPLTFGIQWSASKK